MWKQSDNYNCLTPLGSQTGRPHRTAVSQSASRVCGSCVCVFMCVCVCVCVCVARFHLHPPLSHCHGERERERVPTDTTQPHNVIFLPSLSLSSLPPRTARQTLVMLKMCAWYANQKVLSLDPGESTMTLCVCVCVCERGEVRERQRDMTLCRHVFVSSGEPLVLKLICHTCHGQFLHSAVCLSGCVCVCECASFH